MGGSSDPNRTRATAAEPPAPRPTGTVTFVMTDIEGSTRLLQALGERYPAVLDDHYGLLRDAFGAAGGSEVSSAGDALFFAFGDAPSAVSAAIEAQRRLAAHPWPDGATVRVRMGIHTGQGTLLAGDYVGLDVHRAARIASAAHGGQVVLSDAARALSEPGLPEGATLRDLGEHRLKDLERPERLFQVAAAGLVTEFPPLRSAGGTAVDLPVQLTAFIGRVQEKDELLELLRAHRLVTLTGPGGTGKTRLSIEAAAAAAPAFADGVVFVALATTSDPEQVIPAVAAALHLPETPARPIREVLVERLAGSTMLVVLDNFEQVIRAGPEIGRLLAAAPRVKALVTSREPLRIAGEQEFPVPPLGLPAPQGGRSLEEVESADSVALFVQRAGSVGPGFSLTAENAHAVAEICARLDGLPLAIELAAARSSLFEPPELLARLDRRLSFLAGGRDLPERQRTLRGAIDWSHDLLEEPERIIFRRLSTFAGGCTLEAVEAVCLPADVGADAIEVVSSLHAKSLLRRDEAATGALRVIMLETIREYARERLVASGEAPQVRTRHAAWVLEAAEGAARHVGTPAQQRSLEMLDPELDNIRAAIEWSTESAETETGLRLATALSAFWLYRNHPKEGRRHLEHLLGLPASGQSAEVRAAAIFTAGDLAGWQGDYAASRRLAGEALAMYRELGDLTGVAGQLSLLGYATVNEDPAEAARLFRASIEAYREAGQVAPVGQALIGLSLPEMQLRDLDAASTHLEEAAAIFEAAGDETLQLIASGLLGVCARLAGDLAEARRRSLDVLGRAEPLGAHFALTLPLLALADLAQLEGDSEHAAVLDAGQARLADRLGGTPAFKLLGLTDVGERARAELGNERYEEAVALGRSLPIDELIRLAATGAERPVTRRSACP